MRQILFFIQSAQKYDIISNFLLWCKENKDLRQLVAEVEEKCDILTNIFNIDSFIFDFYIFISFNYCK